MKEECGIVAVYDLARGRTKRNVVPIVIRALLEMQNRGQVSAGLTSYNPGRDRILQTHKDLGTVHEVFSLNTPHKSRRLSEEYAGHAAIGHNRYATSGALESAQAQPFERVHGRMWKWFAFGFNGNLANYAELKNGLEQSGYHITYHADTEVMMHYINRELRGDDPPHYPQLFANLSSIFDGAYNITFLNAAGELVVMRDPLGIKPLCYAVKDDLLVAASENVALTHNDLDDYQTLAPGEMIIANRDGYRIERYWPQGAKAHCFFEWVYFANLASKLEGRSVYKVREAIGRELAAIETQPQREEHLVLAVPETAETVANSFAFHLGLRRVNGLLRNRYVGRTFIDGNNRGENIRLKFTPLRELIEGKNIFLVDDTLVRGTTLKTVVKDLRERGRVNQVHVRIGNPPIMGPCFYGIDMPTVRELYAPAFLQDPCKNGIPLERLAEMAQAIDADSLIYLSHERLIKAVGLPAESLCMACLNGNYPTPMGKKRYEEVQKAAPRTGWIGE